MDQDILKNFSNNYQEVLVKSIKLAWKKNLQIIKPDLLFYALLSQKGCLGSEILQKLNPRKTKVDIQNNSKKQKKLPDFSPTCVKIIEKSAIIAYQHEHQYVATEHLLLAMIESNLSSIDKLLTKNRINKEKIKKQIQIIFNSTAKFQNFSSSFRNYHSQGNLPEFNDVKTPASFLETFTTNLCNKEIQKNIDPIIGREKEIERLIEILMRRNKNNPLILGDPGVGKTALVEGLAKKITKGEVPNILLNKKLLNLDLTMVIAGTMFRGEFENRMKQILEEIKKDPDIIVFIDEIHNIIGAGSSQGSMDVANIIKPALARGEIRCIGATTYEEHKKHLEGDTALERRFQLVKIKEPSQAETITILEGVKQNYEKYHQVKISDEAIKTAVDLSQKYINDRFFPDKALDLLDEASSGLKINNKHSKQDSQLLNLQKKQLELKNNKEQAIIKENFKEAIFLKNQEKEIERQISQLQQIIDNQKNKKYQILQKKHICQVVAKMINLPVGELLLEENTKFLKLEKLLAEKIIGQSQALQTLSRAIRRAKSGISEQNRPLGSFIFLGPSGTGKTHTAKILSQLLFDHPENLIKIDMSEFSEKFNISKLIGAPAGYVGYKESGKLTEAVKKNPNSVVLFDEIEKAHPDIYNLLLQILDEGYLTDATGKKINFQNTFIIMTSNLGNDRLNKLIGFDKDTLANNNLELEAEVKKFFKPEFINRLDKIIIFSKLTDQELKKIIKLEINYLQERLKKQNIEIEYDNQIINHLLKNNYNPEQGARFVKQNIEEIIINSLSEQILKNKKNKNFKLAVTNNILAIN